MSWIAVISRNMQYLMGIGVGGISLVTLYPQTLGLSGYQRVVSQYSNGKEQPLDENTKNLTKKVITLCKLTVEEEASIDFFTCYGNDVLHKGSSQLRTGAIIGLPATFAYGSTEDVNTDKMQLLGEPIDWESTAGQNLLHSLVLSDKAKAYAIGREIQYANTHHVWIEGFLVAGFGLFGYSAGFMLNQMFQLKRFLKRWGRFSVYGAIGLVFCGMYVVLDDTYNCMRDKTVDKRTAALGYDYVCGGQEFYEKLLQRNRALRTLMGRAGEMQFTLYGNERETWRRRHLQLTERRDNLREKVLEHDNENFQEPRQTAQ